MSNTQITSKRIYPGYYEAKFPVTLVREDGSKTVEATLTIETQGEDAADNAYPWTWRLSAEAENFDVYNEDGGYPSKREIMEAFGSPERALRNWKYVRGLGWCI